VAVDKPGGLLVHRTREAAGERRALLQEVAAQVGRYLYPVHRLDRATSGIVVFALSSEDARRLQESLGSPGARKEYLALARGETAERFCVGRPLRDERGARKEARSSFRRLAVFAGCSLLLARIHTGRRHQIRRHLAHCAHQLLGDTTYGKGGINRYFRESFSMPRLCLHAWHLGFEHPRTGRRIGLRAPLAADLREFLARLPDCPASLLDRL
jgi:tRNA pseudouridine65 synthase